MSYAQFLLVFMLPPIVGLALALRRPPAGGSRTRAWLALPLTMMVAFLYTTPWDNYLVYRGVWTYGHDRVVGTIGYVPVEEYLFFLLQPLMTGLLLYNLLARTPAPRPTPWRANRIWRLFAALALTGVGLLASGWANGLYAGLILAWAGPVLAGLWWYGGAHMATLGRTVPLAIWIPTLYLWVADRLAIRLGIWDIADAFSLTFDPFGLPVEEALFFLLTNVLCVAGVVLFLHGSYIQPPSGLNELVRKKWLLR